MSATVSIEAYEDEKARRVYYQDIVYAVCNSLDRIFSNRPGKGVVCGTSTSPSQQVQQAMQVVEHRCTQWAQTMAAMQKGEVPNEQ